MNIRGSIIRNLLESENLSTIEEYNKEIDALIKDEQEAIEAYNNSLIIFKELVPEKYTKISDTIFHIINEEKEHIKELNELRNIIQEEN
nr:MAG TPA: Ubiquinone biosynthesis protein COQ7 [Caudoviricetes sp.]